MKRKRRTWEQVMNDLAKMHDAVFRLRMRGWPPAPKKFRQKLDAIATALSGAHVIAHERHEEELIFQRQKLLKEQRSKGIPEVVGRIPRRLRPITSRGES